MDYSFDVEIAKRYGVNEAVFIRSLYLWIEYNQANGREYRDGKSWTQSSIGALVKLFPFWTEGQLRALLSKLEANGAILTGQYGETVSDKAKWFALTDEAAELCRGHQTPIIPDGIRNVVDNDVNNAVSDIIPLKKEKASAKRKADILFCSAIVTRLNQRAGTAFRAGSQKTRDLISARFAEGFTEADFYTVIDNKCLEWNREPKAGEKDMRVFLRPETLFGTKFEGYLNQKPPKAGYGSIDRAELKAFIHSDFAEDAQGGQT